MNSGLLRFAACGQNKRPDGEWGKISRETRDALTK